MNKYLLIVAFPLLFLSGCGEDKDDINNTTVVIGKDGKTSNGSLFAEIDDKNFYLDYIKYTVVAA